MKKFTLKAVIAAAILFTTDALQAQTCTTARFRDEIFEIDSFEVEYTTVRSTRNKMDIFVPKNDPATSRPLLVLAHGGGFTAGDKEQDEAINVLKRSFARRGYVTASIQYRLANLQDLIDSTKMLREVVWAISDAKAAVRYFTKDAATANMYKIDSNFVFIGGNSAGAILAVHYAYIDDLNELPSYIRDTLNAYGGLEGNSGNDGYSSKVKAVISLAGGINKTSWLTDAQEQPVFMAHGDVDKTVPYNFNQVYRMPPYNSFTLVTLFGSGSMDTALTTRGVSHQLKTYPGEDHCPWNSDAVMMAEVDSLASRFLYPMVCNDFTSAGPTGIEDFENTTTVSLYPNPNTGSFVVKVSEVGANNSLEVYNAMGQLVKQQPINDIVSNVSLDAFGKGLYTIRLKNGNNSTATSRVIVQ